ncbi:hypothetical protein ACFLS8_05485 [Chloroflexota bacterium]
MKAAVRPGTSLKGKIHIDFIIRGSVSKQRIIPHHICDRNRRWYLAVMQIIP